MANFFNETEIHNAFIHMVLAEAVFHLSGKTVIDEIQVNDVSHTEVAAEVEYSGWRFGVRRAAMGFFRAYIIQPDSDVENLRDLNLEDDIVTNPSYINVGMVLSKLYKIAKSKGFMDELGWDASHTWNIQKDGSTASPRGAVPAVRSEPQF